MPPVWQFCLSGTLSVMTTVAQDVIVSVNKQIKTDLFTDTNTVFSDPTPRFC
jgi:hypothetical protein